MFRLVAMIRHTLTAATLLAAASASAAQERPAPDYGAPDLGGYFRSLMQPDAPRVSCCGEADAYYADETEACRPSDGPSCALVAIVTDTRPDAPRGRRHIAPGTRYAVPAGKVRRQPIANPTDHNLLFVGGADQVLCWEPVAGL